MKTVMMFPEMYVIQQTKEKYLQFEKKIKEFVHREHPKIIKTIKTLCDLIPDDIGMINYDKLTEENIEEIILIYMNSLLIDSGLAALEGKVNVNNLKSLIENMDL